MSSTMWVSQEVDFGPVFSSQAMDVSSRPSWQLSDMKDPPKVPLSPQRLQQKLGRQLSSRGSCTSLAPLQARAGPCREDVPLVRDTSDLKTYGKDVNCGTQMSISFFES